MPPDILVFGVLLADMGLEQFVADTLVRTAPFFANLLLNPGMPDLMCHNVFDPFESVGTISTLLRAV